MNIQQKFDDLFITQKEYRSFRRPSPLVSVTIITYQHAKFIKQCLESVLNQQTNFHFEIIIGEDGSNDGTREICISYAHDYPDKIRLFLRNREESQYIDNYGASRSFNGPLARRSAEGQFIAICEGDDYWTDPLKLQKQVDFLQANLDVFIVGHDVRYVDDQDKTISEHYFGLTSDTNLSSHDLAYGTHGFPTSSVMFRNLKLPVPPTKLGDQFLFSYCSIYGRGHLFQKVMGAYRAHSGGVWTGSDHFTRTDTMAQTLIECERTMKGDFKSTAALRTLTFALTEVIPLSQRIKMICPSLINMLINININTLNLAFSRLKTFIFKKIKKVNSDSSVDSSI